MSGTDSRSAPGSPRRPGGADQPPASGKPSAPTRHRDISVIALIGTVHSLSHFFHLILVPLFPWLIAEFGYSYTELGLLMTVFFAVSGLGQSAAGFLVDRVGPVRVLLGALAFFAASALVLASSHSWWALAAGMALAGMGNAPFHPIDFSVMNARVRPSMLGRAYAVHGITGTLGWAFAPLFLASIATYSSWRMALVGAALLSVAAFSLVLFKQALLLAPACSDETPTKSVAGAGSFDFLRLPAVWMSFLFFCVFAFALGGVQAIGPAAAGVIHQLSAPVIALCLTVYMICSAAGMLVGGFIAASPERAERLIAVGFGGAALASFSLIVTHWPDPVVLGIFGAMGFSAGFAGPSRDLLVRRAAPAGATGRVYGVVYSGLDVGMAIAPAMFGMLLDGGRPSLVWLIIGCLQLLMITFAFGAAYATRPKPALVSDGVGPAVSGAAGD